MDLIFLFAVLTANVSVDVGIKENLNSHKKMEKDVKHEHTGRFENLFTDAAPTGHTLKRA